VSDRNAVIALFVGAGDRSERSPASRCGHGKQGVLAGAPVDNLLTVINGFSEILLHTREKRKKGEPAEWFRRPTLMNSAE